jgi:hypothetical protein
MPQPIRLQIRDTSHKIGIGNPICESMRRPKVIEVDSESSTVVL